MKLLNVGMACDSLAWMHRRKQLIIALLQGYASFFSLWNITFYAMQPLMR